MAKDKLKIINNQTNLNFKNMLTQYYNNLFNPFLMTEESITTFSPEYKIDENDNEFSLDLVVPTFKKEDIEIELDGSYLVISGSHKDEYNTKFKEYSKFKSKFRLNHKIDEEKINAKYVSGVLSIVLPKVKKEDRKIISIN